MKGSMEEATNEGVTEIYPVVYSKEIKTRSHIPPARLEYEEGIPKRLATEYRSYDIEAKVDELPAREFFSHDTEYYTDGEIKSVTFKDRAAALYFREAVYCYQLQAAKSANTAYQTDLELEHSRLPGSHIDTFRRFADRVDINRMARDTRIKLPPLEKGLKVNFPEDDLYEGYTREVLEWIENMQSADLSVSKQQMKVLAGRTPFTIDRVAIGNLTVPREQQFFIEERIAEKIIFAAEILKYYPRKTTLIFDNLYMDEPSETSVFYPEERFRTKAQLFFGARGKQTRNIIILNPEGYRALLSEMPSEQDEYRSTSVVIPFSLLRGLADHEAAHHIDRNLRYATTPQAEGFARSVSQGFDFTRSVDALRSRYSYEKEITSDYLIHILSGKPPKGLVPAETYGIPATFFCYVYEHLGPDKFRRFYERLTGGYFDRNYTGIKKYTDKLATARDKNKCVGNVLACLDTMPRDHTWNWQSSQGFVDSYVQAVNEKLPSS